MKIRVKVVWTFLTLSKKPPPFSKFWLRACLPECTFGRYYISPKAYFPEFTLARMYIWPKLHFPDSLFFRNYISSEIHFLETIFHSKNSTMFRLFISDKLTKLLVEIKKRCDNSQHTE